MMIVQSITGDTVIVTLDSLSLSDAKDFHAEFNKALTLRRFRRMALDKHITEALDYTCKRRGDLTWKRTTQGYGLRRANLPEHKLMSGEEFRSKAESWTTLYSGFGAREDFTHNSRIHPIMEMRYGDSPWRRVVPHRVFPWGVSVRTAEGYRNFLWHKLQAVSTLSAHERSAPLRLILMIDKKNRLRAQSLSWDNL